MWRSLGYFRLIWRWIEVWILFLSPRLLSNVDTSDNQLIIGYPIYPMETWSITLPDIFSANKMFCPFISTLHKIPVFTDMVPALMNVCSWGCGYKRKMVIKFPLCFVNCFNFPAINPFASWHITVQPLDPGLKKQVNAWTSFSEPRNCFFFQLCLRKPSKDTLFSVSPICSFHILWPRQAITATGGMRKQAYRSK